MTTLRETTEFVGAAITAVAVETNGFQGGDSGHGGFAVLAFKNLSGTDMAAEVDGEIFEAEREIKLIFRGDSEIQNLKRALLFAAYHLDDLLGQLERESQT